MSKARTGSLGEDVATQFLEKKGYTILLRNYRKPWGEIDIIAEKAGTVRFVEVKAISRESGGGDVSREIDHHPEDMVDRRKLTKLARTAALYMEEVGDEREYQIDVVGVILSHKTKTARCRLLEQAVGESL